VIGRLTAILVATMAGLFALVGAGGEDDRGRSYVVELDNAFGLVEGGDVRVAGVTSGTVADIKLDERTKKALVEVLITEPGVGEFHTDAFCETRPQSPLGEFFVDCKPGTARSELPDGGLIPVAQTASTVPPDLIANIMRLPYRERFRLIVGELGAGLAGRPDDLNAAIRRSVPALRQTSRLLRILATHDKVIRDLVEDADTVVSGLARNKRDVGRFISEARDTSTASAEREADIRENFKRLPRFLGELTPTLAALGEAADEQRPVLVNLRASADELEEFLTRSAELSDASRPALEELGRTARVGIPAARAAAPHVTELGRYARPLVDLAPNLRIVLEDFSDPARAVEKDPRSPNGNGYSGAQALLRYVFSQALVNNGFDELGYMVRAAVHTDHCSAWVDAKKAREKSQEDCRSWLGPNQFGVTVPDPTAEAEDESGAKRRGNRQRATGNGDNGNGNDGNEGEAPVARSPVPTPEVPLPPLLDELLDALPGSPPSSSPDDVGPLLDYLLG
jgi:ABC-type transporter Mla subunit MlaD